ncbi:hypothetical protein NQ315_013329 [Exocentrus adspersus]|uniref:Uncharacterized protein n=1 Tax=Exocentrus adspersus TaxID=1586481 RepID=A0AAV8V5G6_9CUCU|nr:hypothetical protein NQ315_013329 [Exocentrus adspersus]
MDELLGDSPTNSSPHSIDVAELSQGQGQDQTFNAQIETTETQSSSSSLLGNNEDTEKARKRKNPTTEYIKIKKQYYTRKEKEVGKREECQREYIQKSLEMKQKKLDLLNKKS